MHVNAHGPRGTQSNCHAFTSFDNNDNNNDNDNDNDDYRDGDKRQNDDGIKCQNDACNRPSRITRSRRCNNIIK